MCLASRGQIGVKRLASVEDSAPDERREDGEPQGLGDRGWFFAYHVEKVERAQPLRFSTLLDIPCFGMSSRTRSYLSNCRSRIEI